MVRHDKTRQILYIHFYAQRGKTRKTQTHSTRTYSVTMVTYLGLCYHGSSPPQTQVSLVSNRQAAGKDVSKPQDNIQDNNQSNINQNKQTQDGLKGSETIEHVNETGFLEQDIITSGAGSAFRDIGRLTTGGNHNDHVVDYLARWNIYGSIPSNNVTTIFPVTYLNTDIIKNKLHGSFGLNGVFGCKLVWNTQPFIQGLGVLYYQPPGFMAYGPSNPMFATGCPHVIVNFSETTSAELFVPYVGETSFFSTDNSDTRFAPQVGTFNWVPIITTRGAAGDVSVLMKSYLCIREAETFGQFPMAPIFANPPTRAVELEASIALEVAESIKKSKIVSNATASISSFLNKNAGDGIVGTASQVGSWVFGGASKIADLLGWSKPYNVAAIQPVMQNPFADTMTGDMTFTGIKYANNIDAGIGRVDMSDNSQDQLAIKNFCRNEYVTSFSWPTTKTAGDILKTLDYNPAYWYTSVTGTNDNEADFNHLSYLTAVLFNYWRGSIVLTIQPVMTKFHSGRLRVVYSPGGTAPTSTQNWYNQALTYNWVIDLSDPSSWTIEIPYVAVTPWRDTVHASGFLNFYIENDLSVSGSVSNSIDIVLFAMPGDDFEVAVPRTGNGGTTQLVPIELDAPRRDVADVELQAEAIRFIETQSTSESAHSLSIGDPIRSLRSVLKRFWTVKHVKEDSMLVCANAPFTYKQCYPNKSAPDFLTLVALNFGFYRGSMRYHINGYGIQEVYFTTEPLSTVTTLVNGVSETGIEPGGNSTQAAVFGPDVPCKFEIPYYSRSLATNIRYVRGDSPFERIPGGYAFVRSRLSDSVLVSRAIGDDFELGFLIGAPRMRKKLRGPF